jgi:hypothetical protein
MRNLQGNYTQHNYNIGGGVVHNNVRVTETEFKAIHRSASLYKPSIDVVARVLVSTLRTAI